MVKQTNVSKQNQEDDEACKVNTVLVLAALHGVVFPNIFHAEIYKEYLIIGCLNSHYYIYKNGRTDMRRWKNTHHDPIGVLHHLINTNSVHWDSIYFPPS